MADISTGRQRGIVPFVDETTGRLPDQYLPQGVIDLQGDLEQAVTDASQSATAAKASETAAKASETAADSSAQAAAASAESAQTATESAASSKDAAAQSASEASESAQAAEASKTSAAASASAAEASKTSAAASAAAAKSSETNAAASAAAAKSSETNAAASAAAAKSSETNAAASAAAAQQAVDGFGLEVGTTTTGEPGTDAAVAIQKNGNKYTANFTIPTGEKGPKGDPGDLTTVTHDESLYGDGTADNMLKISANMVPSKSTDLIDKSINDLTPGFYMYRSPSGRPGNQYGSVIVLPGTNNQNRQIAVDSSAGGVSRMFVRGMGSNLEYGDWWEVAHQSDVVGTFRNPIKVEQSDLNGDFFDANEYITPGVYFISLLKSQVSEQSIPEPNNKYIRASLVVVKCGVSAGDLAQIWINRAGDAGIPFIAMRIRTTGWQPWQRLAFVSVTQESFSSVELETRMQALEAEVESLKNKQ